MTIAVGNLPRLLVAQGQHSGVSRSLQANHECNDVEPRYSATAAITRGRLDPPRSYPIAARVSARRSKSGLTEHSVPRRWVGIAHGRGGYRTRRPVLQGRAARMADRRDRHRRLTLIRLQANSVKCLVDTNQRAVVVPAAEIFVQRGAWWQVPRDRRPLAPRAQDVDQTIHDLSEVNGPLVATSPRGRDERFDQGPLFVCQIAWMTQPGSVGVVLAPECPHGLSHCTGSHLVVAPGDRFAAALHNQSARSCASCCYAISIS